MRALAQEPANLLREGIEHHKQGMLDQAARLYEQALEVEPSEADALHLLGVIAHQRGDHAGAIERIRRAIAINAEMRPTTAIWEWRTARWGGREKRWRLFAVH